MKHIKIGNYFPFNFLIVYLNIKDKKVIFNNGLNFAFVNNKTNNMGGNFIIEDNKIKIPLDFAKKIGLTK